MTCGSRTIPSSTTLSSSCSDLRRSEENLGLEGELWAVLARHNRPFRGEPEDRQRVHGVRPGNAVDVGPSVQRRVGDLRELPLATLIAPQRLQSEAAAEQPVRFASVVVSTK